jgi:hypothetical protein
MLSTARRRELGAFYTPADVARRLVDIAFTGLEGSLRVCDPACGDGSFLVSAAHALEARGIGRTTIARDLLWGCDIDADAVASARAAITTWAGESPGRHLRVADGLDDIGWSGRFDVVVGNPPFLNQLERATVRTSSTRWRAGAYTDTAFLFLLAGLDLARDGGRVLLIQPQSLVAARDAEPVRAAITSVEGMWTCDEPIFDASVRVCAPLLVRGAPQPERVARWKGREAEPVAPVPMWWSGLLVRPDEPPPLALRSAGLLGDIVTATAGFRDQFYGLAPHVIDEPNGSHPKLVTCGVIDPLHCAWGERPVRFAGRRLFHPRVDLDSMDDGPLKKWVVDRLRPKVLLATQTKVLEPVVDVDGTLVPSTPVIAVHTERVFDVAAVLLAPPITAWAASTYAGVALTSNAIKLSARQVLEVPQPANEDAWRRAARTLESGDVATGAAEMTAAYGCGDDVFEWWRNRWRPASGRRPKWRDGPPGASLDAARIRRVAARR